MSAEALALLRRIALAVERMAAAANGAAGGAAATDRELDSQFGDPIVKATDPRDWTGPSQKGNRLSQCSPEYLDMIADRFAYFATKNELAGAVTDRGKPKADFDRKNERLARGWAKRMRDGKHEPSSGNGQAGGDWDEGGDWT